VKIHCTRQGIVITHMDSAYNARCTFIKTTFTMVTQFFIVQPLHYIQSSKKHKFHSKALISSLAIVCLQHFYTFGWALRGHMAS